MNAINHASTALLINRKWPGVPIIPVLIAVQFVEILWVIFNFAGIEVTTTEPQVRAINDIHLAYMPFSHSIAATAVLAFAVWILFSRVLNKPVWGIALVVALSSHIVLDLATHVQDIALAPGLAAPKLGSGLYGVPVLALLVETAYGIFCWRVFGGSRMLLAVIVAFNLSSLSFYLPALLGPEQFLAGHPKLFAGMIGSHIFAGLFAIGYFARKQWGENAEQQRSS